MTVTNELQHKSKKKLYYDKVLISLLVYLLKEINYFFSETCTIKKIKSKIKNDSWSFKISYNLNFVEKRKNHLNKVSNTLLYNDI